MLQEGLDCTIIEMQPHLSEHSRLQMNPTSISQINRPSPAGEKLFDATPEDKRGRAKSLSSFWVEIGTDRSEEENMIVIEFTSIKDNDANINITKLMLQLFRRFQSHGIPHRITWECIDLDVSPS